MELFALFVVASLVNGAIPLGSYFNKRPRFETPKRHRSVISVKTSETGRVLEMYNENLIEEYYGPWLAREIPHVSSFDNDREAFIPTDKEGMNQTTVFGIFELKAPLAISRQSAIYKLKHRSDVLIKYQANCIELATQVDFQDEFLIHPTVVEFAYTRKASKFGLAPSAYFFSPPAQLCRMRTGKCDFDMSEKSYEACRSDPNASLRYMIMDRVRGRVLMEYQASNVNRTVPFAQAMLIGERLMSMIEVLHKNASIVHGDIHHGNIMVESESPLSMKFIDLARSFENIERQQTRIRNSGWSTHPILSHWELDGYLSAARDDVARIISVVAVMINGPEYGDFLKTMSLFSSGTIFRWKAEANIFAIPQINGFRAHDPVSELRVDFAVKLQIGAHLQQILSLVRQMDDINAVPPYAIIRDLFKQCYDLVTETH
jgi:hypothetical protein